jgi:dihydrolipoamide dehydrogenase
MIKYDLIVIGGGAAGITASRGPASQGWQVAMIEKEYMGGTCTNVGCMPTKALLASAHFLHQAKHADAYAIEISGACGHWPKVQKRMQMFVESLRAGSERFPHQFDNMKFYRGEARFTGPRTLIVNDTEITAEKIIIAAGARSFIPTIQGLDTIDYLTSTSALALAAAPEHLCILGGGVLSVEFAQIFSRLGSKVTIVEQNDQILGNFDDDIAAEFTHLLAEEGIHILTGHTVSELKNQSSGVDIILKDKSGKKALTASAVMIATGRKPNTDLLNLESAGIKTDGRGFIVTDRSFQTSAEGIWAIGDILGGAMFTHKARHDGMLMSSFLVSGKPIDNRNRIVPFSVFTDPEIAVIGETEKSAGKKQIKYVKRKLPYGRIGRAGASTKTSGFIKILVSEETRNIIGAQIMGENAGDIIHTIAMTMHLGGTIEDLQEMIPIHPTYAEGLYSTAMLF